MSVRIASACLALALAVAALVGVLHKDTVPEATPILASRDDEAVDDMPPETENSALGLGAPAATDDFAPADEEPAALTWRAPAAWPSLPNPSTMRLATHRIPGAGGAEDAELSITRAGGDVASNVERWVGQLRSPTNEEHREKTVRGVSVTIVEVDGTYVGGMGASSAPHPGWALLGAIVVTAHGQPYFFKMTGPAATVHAARAGFDALIDSIDPR